MIMHSDTFRGQGVLFVFSLIFLVISGFSLPVEDRKTTISGKVTDATGRPVNNAIIIIDHRMTGTKTDSSGIYCVRVRPGAETIGIFTFCVGIMEEQIEGRDSIDFVFNAVVREHFRPVNPKTEAGLTGKSDMYGEQAVNVGYAWMKMKDVASDISVIDGTNRKYASYPSVKEMIVREVPGARISGGTVVLNGTANLFGPVGALVIIDGVYGASLDDISPVTVKNISILKGASAAIYGSNGFGGVILITTKSYDEE
jgi:TonB-dependent starch-binding outer membrane protein SusC